MLDSFLYNTHYQVDKPLALLDLTLDVASPTEHASDDALARRLDAHARTLQVSVDGDLVSWKPNRDQMLYWIGNSHDAGLLSQQNSQDYWLMNFRWVRAFQDKKSFWGQLQQTSADLSRMLLFRWGWVFDAPMLVALLWKMNELGTPNVGDIVAKSGHHVEDILCEVFAAIRDTTADPRTRTSYRQKIEEVRRGLQPNTRRHKVCTHVGILTDAGILTANGGNKVMHAGLGAVMGQFATAREAVAASLRAGSLGRGSALFLDIVENAFALKAGAISEIHEEEWEIVRNEVRKYWEQIEKWDRKFLGIRALAELFLVKNLFRGSTIWSVNSWQAFLTQRARFVPEELTVHVDRFGRVEYLRLSSA
ncbi:MAG: hypothetical protein ABSF77_03575 [Spirochaetia bacterium]|jgi:hypothetical protein